MRLLFFGIYDIGVQALANLCRRGKNVVAVVTKPGTETETQPVAAWAAGHGLAVLQPPSPKNAEFIRQIHQFHPDLITVAGYHKIIPKAILDVPPRGTMNLHGSLLPKYRGPSTWKWAIINGESHTGVSVHVMTPQLDNGDILAQRPIPIAPDDTGGSLFQKISSIGAELLGKTIEDLERGNVVPKPQNETQATYYGNPTEEDMRIPWHGDAERIRNLVRGLNPRPGAWTSLNRQRVRVWKVTSTDAPSSRSPGEIVGCSQNELRVATQTRDLVIAEMTIDGSPAAPWQELQYQGNLQCGERFV